MVFNWLWKTKQRNEPIRTNQQLPVSLQSTEQFIRARCNWFWFCFSLVEKLVQEFLANHQG